MRFVCFVVHGTVAARGECIVTEGSLCFFGDIRFVVPLAHIVSVRPATIHTPQTNPSVAPILHLVDLKHITTTRVDGMFL
jgi:hypothetical protein